MNFRDASAGLSWTGEAPRRIAEVRRVGLGVSLALLSACQGTEHLPTELEPGAGVVALVLDGRQRAVRAERLDRPDGTTELVELDAEQSLVVFALPRDAFVDAWGAPLEDSFWRAFRPLLPRQSDAQLGRCGRCQIPSKEPPHNSVPGDRCRVPGWIEAALVLGDGTPLEEAERGAWAEAARAQLELAWPGECDCEPAPPPARVDAEVCPLGAPEAMLGPTEVAIADDGTVFGTAFGYSLRVSPSGEVDTGPITPSLRDADQIMPAAVGGLFVVVSRSIAFGNQSPMLRYLGPDLRERAISGLPGQRISRIEANGAEQLVFLGRESHTASLITCDLHSDEESLGMTCTDWLLEDSETCPQLHLGSFFRAALDLGEQGMAAITSIGVLARLVPAERRLACIRTPERSGVPWPLSAEVTFVDPSLGAIQQLSQDRFLALVGEQDGRSPFANRWAIVLGHLEQSPGSSVIDRVRFELQHLSDPSDAPVNEFLPLADGPGVAAVAFDGPAGHRIVVFDETGALIGSEPGLRTDPAARTRLREIPAPILTVSASPNREWLVALDAEQNLYRRPPGGPFQRITARAPLLDAPTGAIVELDAESALALTPTGAARVRPGDRCGQDELEPVALEGELPSGLVAAARDRTNDGRYLVLGQRTLARLDLQQGRVQTIDAPPPPTPWHSARALGPGSFVLSDRAGALFVLHADDRLEPLATATERSPLGLYEVVVEGGVVWTGGPDHLGRYRFVGANELAGGENLLPDLDAESWRAVDANRKSRPQVDGLAPRCRDVVLVHTNENLHQLSGVDVTGDHRYWELVSSTSGYLLRPSPDFELEGLAVARLHESSPELIWMGERAFSLSTSFGESTVYTFGTAPRSLPFPSLGSIAPAGSWILAAGGRLERLNPRAADADPVLGRREDRRGLGFRLAKTRAVARR